MFDTMDTYSIETDPLLKRDDQRNRKVLDLISSGAYTEFSGARSGDYERVDIKDPEKENTKACRRPKFIEPVVLLYYLAYGCNVPIQEQFVKQLISDHYNNDFDWSGIQSDLDQSDASKSTCNGGNSTISPLDDIVQSESSLWLMYIKLANTLPAVISTLILCSYGDFGGRKLGILLPAVGGALKILGYTFVILFKAPLYTLLIGNLIEGILGSHLTFIGNSYAYLADTTSKSSRALRFTILQTMSVLPGLAHIPLGYWIDATGFLQPFWFVAAVFILDVLYIVILLPDSYPSHYEQGNDPGIIETIRAAVGSFSIYSSTSSSSQYSHFALICLLLSFIFRVLFEMGKSSVETLFMLAAPLCLSSTAIGIFNTLQNFIQGVVGLAVAAVLLRCMSDIVVCLGLTFVMLASRVVFAFAENIWILYTVPVIGFGQNVTLSLTRALMSKMVDPENQGALFATIFTLETVCDVFSGTLFNTIYASTVSNFKGVVFLVQAVVLGIGAVFLLSYYCIMKYSPISESKIVQETSVENTKPEENSN